MSGRATTSGQGTTLCPKHARQAARERVQPSGPCDVPTWTGGQGQQVTCDVLVAPDRVEAYMAYVASR